MPFKPGGGYVPQPYNAKNGQYIDKMKFNELELHKIKKFINEHTFFVGDEPNWPTFSWHNDEYNKIFVQAYRHRFNPQQINENKIKYLLTWKDTNDKSNFLIKLGYNISNIQCLQEDLINCAKFELSIYNKIHEYGLKIYVPVKLKNKFVVASWIFENKSDRKLKFVTLLEKEKTYEKLFKIRW